MSVAGESGGRVGGGGARPQRLPLRALPPVLPLGAVARAPNAHGAGAGSAPCWVLCPHRRTSFPRGRRADSVRGGSWPRGQRRVPEGGNTAPGRLHGPRPVPLRHPPVAHGTFRVIRCFLICDPHVAYRFRSSRCWCNGKRPRCSLFAAVLATASYFYVRKTHFPKYQVNLSFYISLWKSLQSQRRLESLRGGRQRRGPRVRRPRGAGRRGAGFPGSRPLCSAGWKPR